MTRVEAYTLEDGDVRVSLLTLGCITQSWQVPFDGGSRHVVLGFKDIEEYTGDGPFIGIIAGRVANRIAGAQFSLNGETFHLEANNGPNTLHGGPSGLGKRIWSAERDGPRSVRFTYISPDGEGGFPGTVQFSITVSLSGACLTYDMTGVPDRPTPISLAQHSYYILAGGGDVMDHTLKVRASRFTETDDALLPNGRILPVAGTSLDFTMPRTLGDADPDRLCADDNLVIDAGDGPIAELSAPNSPALKIWSDQPGLQLYTGKHLSGDKQLHAGQRLIPFAGVALEPQGFPDAVNQPSFPSVIATPEQPYRQITRIEIA